MIQFCSKAYIKEKGKSPYKIAKEPDFGSFMNQESFGLFTQGDIFWICARFKLMKDEINLQFHYWKLVKYRTFRSYIHLSRQKGLFQKTPFEVHPQTSDLPDKTMHQTVHSFYQLQQFSDMSL